MLGSGLFSLLFQNYLLQKVLRLVGSGVLGLIMLAWVVSSVGPTRGTVVVHVVDRDVRLQIGPKTFRVHDNREPIVCELPSGEHRLRLSQGDQTLDEQTFHLHGGEWLSLSAFDRAAYRKRRSATTSPDPTARIHRIERKSHRGRWR